MGGNNSRRGICDEAVGLLVTYRCNLHCKYCYVRKKRNKDMTLEMAQSILEPFLLKRKGLLDIKFYGGETLLAIDMIRPLVEWVEQGHWNRPYRFFGSTNGTMLNAELKEWLKKRSHLFTLGLSYDGLPSAQIANRGNNDIDVNFFIQTWPKQPIQMTINVKTVEKMADGVISLLKKGAVVHPNVAYEDYEWPNAKIVEYGNQLNKLIYFYMENKNFPLINQFVHDLNEYVDCIDNPKPQCKMCGAGDGFQLFDTDGYSYPCHILSPLVLESYNLLQIKNGLVLQCSDFSDPRCKSCPYISSCPTCMACNFLYRGSLRHRDATHCRIMKTEVKAFIKREVLRLMDKEMLSSEDAAEIDDISKIVSYEKMIRNYYP